MRLDLLLHEKLLLKKHNIFRYIRHKNEIKRIKKNIIKRSPSFDELWELSDFIKMAENVFFYDNSLSNNDICLFSSDNYQDGMNGFKLTTKEVDIIIKLYKSSNTVSIGINRKNGSKIKTLMDFKNNDWKTEPSIYDEMLLELIIKEINKKTIMLFEYCYNLL